MNDDEIDTLNRLVTIFLETAELRVKDRYDLTLPFWRDNVDKLLDFHGKKVLHGNGCITNAEMEKHVKKLYENFDQQRKTYEAKLADEEDMRELKQLENAAKDIEREN